MPGRITRAKKPRISTDAVYDDFVNSDMEFSHDDAETENESDECNTQCKRIRIGSAFLTLDDEQFIEGDSDDDEFQGFSNDDLMAASSASNQLPQAGVESQWVFTEKKSIKWCAGNIKEKDFNFEHSADIDDVDGIELSPLEYFMKYIPEEIFDAIVTFTNVYAEQQQTKKWYPTNKSEIKQFIGLQVYMGNLKLPRIEMFYSKDLDLKMFRDTIPIYRFYLLRTNLHLIDVETIPKECTDKFVRVRPLMDAVRKRCLELPVEEFLSVDEQMIPMRGRVSKGVKQYVKNKPKIKWGIKNLVLCGKSGLAYDFICYQGSTTEFDPKMLSTFGSGATMVLHLANRIDRSGHKLYFDNYFSTFQLFEVLAQKKIYAAGTVRLDRFAKPPFTSDAEMKRKGRGSSEQKISADGSVVCVKWFDNKCVALASNYVGIGVPDKAHRFDKSAQQKLSIERPQIVREYNINMGGVDLMNQMISYYRIFIRSKKWTLRMICHFIDFAIVQSWIEYKMDCRKLETPSREIMDLLAFRMKLAKQLVDPQSNVKRTSRLTLDEIRSKHDNNGKSRESKTDHFIRYDGYNHLPKHTQTRLRCKLESCNLKSLVICSKCNVHLCCNTNNDCFFDYHMKQ